MYVLELGGQDDPFARREAASAASDVAPLAPGLATARGVTDRARHLAYTHRACELVGTGDPDIGSAEAVLEAAALDREGTVAVRAVDVRASAGIDTQRAERALGGVLTDRGFAVDLERPDHTLYAYFADPAGDDEIGDAGGPCCALGWQAVESRRDFGSRRPTDRPFFQPGSMAPLEARALVNVAGARPGATVVDPMCGTGGLLLEAGLVGARAVGGDAQAKMVRGARENLRHVLDGPGHPGGAYPDPGGWDLVRADAARLPLADRAADAVVFDAPYGRQSRIEGDLAPLVSGALAESRRIAPRCVLVADRDWSHLAREAGWTVTDRFERRVHRSLVRHVHVLA
ncbi:TIGR01177 family methyltransferase [Haloarcula laminariae]|uniref:TIGR01177 family methyltransferase n=1 Tax=Haloarcula laminariae TaxID=2961577 RepID=UPI002406203C|nr:TIGR01177 family methyltransferase [Halomicroarcula sp. FL173]